MLPRMEEIFAYFFNLSTFVFDEILVAFPKSGYISEAFFLLFMYANIICM